MSSKDWNKVLTGLLLAPIPLVARAETYLTEEQAAHVLFPGIKLEAQWMDLSGTKVRIWWGPHKEALIIDKVLGKHQYITYAVAITPNGKVKGIEILDYRETFGYQIRDKSWRDHFVGKSLQDPLRLEKDIPNISGATLSSKHVTEGVRRVLQTYDLLKNKAQAG